MFTEKYPKQFKHLYNRCIDVVYELEDEEIFGQVLCARKYFVSYLINTIGENYWQQTAPYSDKDLLDPKKNTFTW